MQHRGWFLNAAARLYKVVCTRLGSDCSYQYGIWKQYHYQQVALKMSDWLSCVSLYYIGHPESKDIKAIKFLEVFVNNME
jgi:hypothetical protein